MNSNKLAERVKLTDPAETIRSKLKGQLAHITARTLLEDNARRKRIAVLQAHIADCDREIQMLADAMERWE